MTPAVLTPLPALFGITAVALAFLITGIAVYSGRWRSWATGHRVWFAPGCGMLFVGIAIAVFAALLWALRFTALPTTATLTVVAIGVICGFLGLMSFFWLPKVLLPTWFKALPKHEWNPK